MDSGFGAIGRKIIRQVGRATIDYWQWQQNHPVKNAAWLITWLTILVVIGFYQKFTSA
jgi:hypothetical protein